MCIRDSLHLMHPSLDRPHSPPQTASRSSQPVYQCILSGETDRQTHRRTCEWGISPFTTVRNITRMVYLLIRFITASWMTQHNCKDSDHSHRLLTPTTPSLLLQAARGISSGSSYCWQWRTIIGPGDVCSAIQGMQWKSVGAWKCSHGYHFQPHRQTDTTGLHQQTAYALLIESDAFKTLGLNRKIFLEDKNVLNVWNN